jgi:hypothetical protein
LADLSALVLRSFPFFHTGAIIDLWWPFLRSDDILFHISLYLSAHNLETLQQRAGGYQSRLAKTEALRLLHEAIQEGNLPSDQTMLAVAHLTTIEVFPHIYEHGFKDERSDMKTLRTHLNGLKRMVHLRGGLDAIKSANILTANIVFWYVQISTLYTESTYLKKDVNDCNKWTSTTAYSIL